MRWTTPSRPFGTGACHMPSAFRATRCSFARLGFGLGAVTEFGGVCSVNTSDWDTYIQASGDFTKITERVEPLSSENAER